MAEFSSTKPLAGPIEDEPIERRTLRDYYIMLRERVWIALPVALVLALGVGYYQARQTPMYMATATMQFEKPETIVTTQGVVDPGVHSEYDLNTYIQVLNSGMLRSRVVNSLTPDEDQILLRPALKKLKPGQPTPPIASELGTVSFEEIRNTFLIKIVALHPDPEAAAIVANHYLQQFMEQLMEEVGGKDAYAVNYLRDRANELKKESEDAEARLGQYMRQHNLVSLDKSIDIVSDRLRSVNSALTAAQLSLLNLQNLSAQVDEYRHDQKDPLEINYVAIHGDIPKLRDQLAEYQQEQITLSDRYLERHPKMIALADNISATRQQLDHAIDGAIDDLHAELGAARQNVKALQDEYAQHEREELELRALSVDYNTLLTQEQVAKQNYENILDRLNQNTTTKNLEKVPLRPLDFAVPNYTPYAPNMHGIVRTAVGLFVLVFIGVAVGLNFVDDRIKSAWDVEAFLGVNLLGIVPDLTTMQDDKKYSLLQDSQHAPGAEAFLGIYSSVKIHSKLDFPKALLITSTIPDEGKTLTSSNIAACFARHGKTTLLMDCDLRRPTVHRRFNQQNNAGIISWYEAGGALDGDLMANPSLGITKIGENFWLLTSGGRSKSPTEILENPLFGQLIDKLKKQFDLVVIDSPPMGAVTDALLIAERADEVIYVCRFNRAFRKHIKLYIRALLNGKNMVLGIVLNGLSPRRIEYYSNYRYYRSYKKYYSAQT